MSFVQETFANAYASTLSGNGGTVSSGATSFYVASLLGSPDASSSASPTTGFRAIIDGDSPGPNTEIIWVLDIDRTTGHITNCVRAAETYPGGCAAGFPVSHSDGVPIRAILTQTSYENLGTAAPVPSGFGPAAYDLLAWSMDPALFGYSGNPLPGAGEVYCEAIPVGKPIEVTNIVIGRGAAGVGLSDSYLALFDSTGSLLGVTADLSTGWMAAPATPPDEYYPLVGGPISVAPSSPNDWVYVGFLIGAWTGNSPNFSAWGDGTLTNLSTGPHRSGVDTSSSGLTAMPSSITPSSIDTTGRGYWVALA